MDTGVPGNGSGSPDPVLGSPRQPRSDLFDDVRIMLGGSESLDPGKLTAGDSVFSSDVDPATLATTVLDCECPTTPATTPEGCVGVPGVDTPATLHLGCGVIHNPETPPLLFEVPAEVGLLLAVVVVEPLPRSGCSNAAVFDNAGLVLMWERPTVANEASVDIAGGVPPKWWPLGS